MAGRRRKAVAEARIAAGLLLLSPLDATAAAALSTFASSTTTTTTTTIRIGTRPSPLAVVQAKSVARKLELLVSGSGSDDGAIFNCDWELVRISASGDVDVGGGGGDSPKQQQQQAAAAAQQPLAYRAVDFTGALDSALFRGDIDIAVHSLKDVPPSRRWNGRDDENDNVIDYGESFDIRYPLPREDPSDVLVGPYSSIESLPVAAKVGTSSIRRQAQLLSVRPDLRLENVRGNLHDGILAL